MRTKILELLEDEYSALDVMTINDRLNLKTVDELKELQYELDLLVSEHIVYFTNKNRYILFTKCPDFRKGRMQVNKSGNGFVVLEDEADIFVDRDNVGLALNGDIVLVKIMESHGSKREGMIVKVLERDLHNIVGEIKSDGTSLYFEPNEKLKITLTVDANTLNKCVEGEIVVVSIVDDLGKNRYIGVVSQHICHKDDANQDILTIAANHEIYPEFPEEAMMQAQDLPNEISGDLLLEEKKNRVDLTSEEIFTIDGEDTKDVDDAISLKMEDGYYVLRVSIADVSHYVTEGSPLDLEALKRGTSSYLAYSVIPMLPHKLSNGICSLNPNVIRCALTCEMKIDERGVIVDSSIYPSLIKSKKKMTYTAVNHLLEENRIDPGYEEYADTLKAMQELAHIIRNRRVKRGATDFNVKEAKIICDANGRAIDIGVRKNGEGERLIEDFMVAANETVSTILKNMGVPSLYRVHDTPLAEKVQSFIRFCGSCGINIKGKFDEITNPKMFQSLLKQIDVPERQGNIIRALAIRSMPKAYYSANDIGHFGLAVIPPYESYTHFTSPIRRYPDLQIHRLIWTYIVNKQVDERTINYWETKLPSVAEAASKREVEAVNAEREVDKMKMAEYMEQHIGEEFIGVVAGVVGFGLFVQLDNLVEGLVPLDSLDGNNFVYDEEMNRLVDEASKKIYRIGDEIKVKCVRASKVDSEIDFEEVRVKELKKDEDEPVKRRELKMGKGRHHD